MNSIEKTEICIRWTMCNTREQVVEAGEESSKAARGKPKVKSDNIRKDSRSSPLLVQSLAMSFAPGLLRISGLVHHNAQVGM